MIIDYNNTVRYKTDSSEGKILAKALEAYCKNDMFLLAVLLGGLKISFPSYLPYNIEFKVFSNNANSYIEVKYTNKNNKQ